MIREAALLNGIIDEMVASIRDERDQSYVKHALRELIMQRVTQICHGYEDVNDCDFLKDDVAIKVATGRLPGDSSLASQPTMTRLKNGVSKRDLIRLFLHSAAYVIMNGLRPTALKGTELANATFDTIRLRLLKIAARVQISKTFVRFYLPQTCPVAPIFRLAVARIDAVRLN